MADNNTTQKDSLTGEETLQPQQAYANVNGIRMYYEIYGTGKPLVLLHGGGSNIQTSFKTLIPLLQGSRQIVAIEFQSHGRTSNRATPESFVQDADDLAELLKQLHLSKVDVLGFSNGGQTAIEFALRHQQLLDKLILLSTFYKREAAPPEFWEFMKNGTFADMPQRYKDEFLKVNNNQQALLAMYHNDAQRMQNFTGWSDEDLRNITAPTLIVLGDRDLVSPAHGSEMQQLIKNSRLLILPGNHGSYFGEAMSWDTDSETPKAFAAVLREFLKS